MKKKLEAELISIAHRILKLKNKSDLDLLHLETQKLYETLSILKFAEKHLNDVKPTIGLQDVEEKLEELAHEAVKQEEETALIDEEHEIVEVQEAEEESADEITSIENDVESDENFENTTEEIEDEQNIEEEREEENSDFEPSFELNFEEEKYEEKEEVKSNTIVFEDFLGDQYKDLEFVKAESIQVIDESDESEIAREEKTEVPSETIKEEIPVIKTEEKEEQESKAGKAITFGLNDRIGFVSHLFDGSNEDFNRVLSQLSTFNSFEDAKNFIEDMVKPDYNDWKGKEDFETRFFEVIENKFK